MTPRLACAVAILAACAATAAAQDDHFPRGRILGSVEIPALHAAANRGGPEPASTKPVTLYTVPVTGARAMTVVRARSQVLSVEHGYEQVSAGVVEIRMQGDRRWYRVQFQVGTWLGTGWLSPRDAGTYHPLASMLKSGLPFLTDGWDGSLYGMPRAGAKRRVVGRAREHQDIRVLATSGDGEHLWLRVQVIDRSPCAAGPTSPAVVATGWMPAYSRDGRIAAWHHSRGC